MPNRIAIDGNYRYAYQGQEKDTETSKEAFEARVWDSRISGWISHYNVKNYHSPYWGMGNNPINTIDPDGNDIVVLNHSTGASGYGHLALLVGNDNDGWRFISKEGRMRSPDTGKKAGTMLTGGKSSTLILTSTAEDVKFVNLAQALTHSDIDHYDQAIYIKSTSEQDEAAFVAAKKSSESWYHVIFNNCGDACSKGLYTAGFNGARDINNDRPVPNQRFEDILKVNSEARYFNPRLFDMFLDKPKAIISVGTLQQLEIEN